MAVAGWFIVCDITIWSGCKETNNIDEQALDVKKAQEFVDEKLVYG